VEDGKGETAFVTFLELDQLDRHLPAEELNHPSAQRAVSLIKPCSFHGLSPCSKTGHFSITFIPAPQAGSLADGEIML
jgi:hypothetical protein